MIRAHLAASLALAACASVAAAEVQTRTLEIAQERRTYILFTPDAARPLPTGLPLVVAMHGGAGTAEQMMGFSRFNAIAAREGFAVAYPQGRRRQWNDGRVFEAGN